MAELNNEIMYNNNAINSLINRINFKNNVILILTLVNVSFILLNVILVDSEISLYIIIAISCIHIIANIAINFYSIDI